MMLMCLFDGWLDEGDVFDGWLDEGDVSAVAD
jgi:hypothetical protein